MTRGNVQLNGVHYITKGLPGKSLANQMASKVGQGETKYSDLTSWSAWAQRDWQEGVGKLEPGVNGGMLYSEIESRVPNQLILSGQPKQVDQRDLDASLNDCRYMPNNVAGTWTISSAGPNTKAAAPFLANNRSGANPGGSGWPTNFEYHAWVYLRAAVGTELNFEIRNDTAGSPGSTVYISDTVTVTGDTKGFYWYGFAKTGNNSIVNGTQYWITVFPTSGSIEVAYGSSGYATASKLLVSGSWTAQTSQYMLYSTSVQDFSISSTGTTFGKMGGYAFGRLGSNIYLVGLATEIYKYDTTNDEWDDSGTSTNLSSTSSTVEWNGKLYISNWTAGAFNAYSLDSGGSAADLGYKAHVFARNGGTLWRSVDNIPYYTTEDDPDSSIFDPVTGVGDWVTWPQMKIGTEDHPIVSMCGVDDDMFVATAEGLYRIAPGDFSVGITPWSSTDPRNGLYMVNFQGALYVSANGRVLRYQSDGTLQDVWIMRDDDLVAGRLGRVRCLCVVNNMVMVLANSEEEGGFPTVWAFVNEEWHHIVTLPYATVGASRVGHRNYAMMHDTNNNYLWIVTPASVSYRLYMSEAAINPYNDSATLYQPYGWVEWDWFDSPVFEAEKDFHSVRIFGENFAAGQSVTVYWKDDASTGWEELGTVAANNGELEWTITGGTRPNTTRFKLALLLKTTSTSETPRIRAIRVKYHLMVKDWWRWNLQIECAGRSDAYLMMLDGTRMALTNEQINTNIEALAVQTPPFVYVDVDNKQWLVKVQDAQFSPSKQDYNEDTSWSYFEGTWSIVIESVKSEQYSV